MFTPTITTTTTVRGHAQARYPSLLVGLALTVHALTLTVTEPALTVPLPYTLTATLTCNAYFRPSTPRSPPLPPTKHINPHHLLPFVILDPTYLTSPFPSTDRLPHRIRKRSPPWPHPNPPTHTLANPIHPTDIRPRLPSRVRIPSPPSIHVLFLCLLYL